MSKNSLAVNKLYLELPLFKQAFVHKSVSSDHNNERLEFLGDAVLEIVISEYLFNRFAGRSIQNQNIGNYVPFIQTDVAINPGNSGGPLFDLDGKVVGINSQIYSRSGGYQGLAFAIPIDVAMEVASQIIEDGSVARGYLGVRVGEVDNDLAEALSMEKPYGALITDVEKGESGDDAGLQAGDVIIEFNGKEIKFGSDLPHVRLGQINE